MKSPYVVTVVSQAEKLAKAARLFSKAEEEMEAAWVAIGAEAQTEGFPHGRSLRLSETAYFTCQQALMLFEQAGDFNDPSFKQQLAERWQTCASIVIRIAQNGPNLEKIDLGLEALYYSASERAVQLHGELIGNEINTDEQFELATKQLYYLHNLAMWAMRMGSLSESEVVWLRHIELLKRLAQANDSGVHNPRDWLVAHFHLAFIRQTLGRSDEEVIATIDTGLAGFEPSKCVGPTALEYCHYLTQLKSEILSAQLAKE